MRYLQSAVGDSDVGWELLLMLGAEAVPITNTTCFYDALAERSE